MTHVKKISGVQIVPRTCGFSCAKIFSAAEPLVLDTQFYTVRNSETHRTTRFGMLNTHAVCAKNLRFLAQTQNTTASSRFVEAAGGRCVHCFVRSTGVGISRTCSSQVRPRRVSPLARAVRRPLVDDRRPTLATRRLATRFVAEDAFSFFLPRGVRRYRNVCISRSVRTARAASGAACASRARLATRLLRPRESDPLPRHLPPRLRSPRFAPC